MNKIKIIISIILVFLPSLLAGCQAQNVDVPTDPTEPSASSQPTEESTHPTVTELELELERIKTSVTAGITYPEMIALLGSEDADTSQNPMNCFQSVWFLEDRYEGTCLEVQFLYPGYSSLEQWRNDWAKASGLPTKTYPDGTVVYDFAGVDYLSDWVEGMEAVSAIIRQNKQTVEVLFGEDFYANPAEDVVFPRTATYFKANMRPHMTYGEAKELFGRWDWNSLQSSDWNTVSWNLEDGSYVMVYFYPVANEFMHEYLATEPTEPNGEKTYELIYYGEWNRHMEAYKAMICRSSPYEVIEVLFDCGSNPWSAGE